MRIHLAWIAALSTGCADAPITVAGFYEGRTLGSLQHQASPDLLGTRTARGGARFGVAHPDGFYRAALSVFAEELDVNTPEGPARLSGGGAGFSFGGRRIEGVHAPDSHWILPYRFTASAISTTGSSRPVPGIEYERMTYGDARFDLGLGVEFSPVIFHAGLTAVFLNGRLDARSTAPGGAPRRQTVNGANLAPYAALELIYAEERPIRLELRVSGGDVEGVAFSAGVGF